MHRIFLLQDLIREILTWVDSPQTAFAIAISASLLSEVGLEAVWRYGNTWNLAMTVPEHFLSIIETQGNKSLLMLADVPRSPGWAGPRFPLYARSIRALDIKRVSRAEVKGMEASGEDEAEETESFNDDADPSSRKTVHPSVLEVFAQYFPDGSKQTFPRLTTLSLHWSPDGASAVRALATSSLRSFHLSMRVVVASDLPATEGVLEVIRNASPALDTFALYASNTQGPANLVACVRSWIYLKSVLLSFPIDDELLSALAASPHLATLQLGCLSKIKTLPNLQDAFRALCRLYLPVAKGFKTATALLTTITSPSLESVKISPPDGDGWSLEPLAAITRALSRHTQLRSIRLTKRGRTLQTAYRPPLYDLRDLVAPLLHLRRLRCLSISVTMLWRCNDGAVTAMANAWPELEELSFTLRTRNFHVSLGALALVLHACPHLRSLGVPINILSPVPAQAAFPAAPNFKLSMLRFNAANEPPETFDVGPLASFLRAACPSADYAVAWELRGNNERLKQIVADARRENGKI